MEKIASFTVDHTKLTPGIYLSRQDGDITTYDIRMRRPNCEEVIDNASLHTIEHLFATFARNSEAADKVIYFGPMGCRTGSATGVSILWKAQKRKRCGSYRSFRIGPQSN